VKALRLLLQDRRRSQRGSVLSATLILVAFLAIIVGALMTELSTNLLLSKVLLNRVNTEATVNSAMELAFNQLQSAPLMSACPTLSPANLNGRTAAVGYVSCWPTVDRRSAQFVPIASSGTFNIDGVHAVLQGNGQDLYLVGDSGGNVYQFNYGQSTPNWFMALGSIITGPLLVMPDVSNTPPDISNLVPVSRGGASGCPANGCVELMTQDVGLAPDAFCFMAANAPVTSRPTAGVAFPQIAYFGDSGGTLFAYLATEPGNCALQTSKATPVNAAIVAGPVVLQNGARDEIYVVTSKGSTAQLLRYGYQQSPASLSLIETDTLPFSNPVGLALENTGVAPRIAITFAGGQVAIYNTNSSFDPSLAATKALGAGIADAPYWCSCPAGSQIGVGGLNGVLYVLDTSLNVVASSAGGPAIRTTPASDQVGEWYFGADDGYLHEVQQTAGQPALVQVALYGWLGRVGSSVQVAACPAGICIYLGSSNNAYLVPLDARDAVLSACIAASPPACSGANPRLWAQVEVGAAGSPQTVHVQGWSYYSP